MLSRWNGRGIWKVRPTPLLMIRCGDSPAISFPSKMIDPALGTSVPESMLKIVLFPEPFGPISPRISPRASLNDTLLTAVKPPKRFTNPLTVSTSATPTLSCDRDFTLPWRGRVQPESSPKYGPLESLIAERGSLRQRQHGLALHLALRPHHIGLPVDILQHHRI